MTEWPRVPLRRVASVVAGQSPPSDEVTDLDGEGLPFLQGNAEFGPTVPTAIYSCNTAAKRGQAGDTLVSVRAPVGALNMCDGSYGLGRGLAAVRPGPELDARFCWWWMHTAIEGLRSRATGSTYDAVSTGDIGSMLVPLASLAEQRGIADLLDAETARIDDLIVKKRQLAERLNERFESAVFAAITQGPRAAPLKPSGISWAPDIPIDWSTPTVSMNFELQLGKMLNAEAAVGLEQYPYLRNVNVQWDRLELEDLDTMHFDVADRRRCELRAGDLLVCEGGEVGRAAVWGNEIHHCYFQKALHRLRPRQGANSRFLMYCLRAAARRNVFSVEGNQSTIVHLTGDQLAVHRLPWPPSQEQSAIVEYLDRLAGRHERARSACAQQLSLLGERRQVLVMAAVSGTHRSESVNVTSPDI